jgi:hypothetical protein
MSPDREGMQALPGSHDESVSPPPPPAVTPAEPLWGSRDSKHKTTAHNPQFSHDRINVDTAIEKSVASSESLNMDDSPIVLLNPNVLGQNIPQNHEDDDDDDVIYQRKRTNTKVEILYGHPGVGQKLSQQSNSIDSFRSIPVSSFSQTLSPESLAATMMAHGLHGDDDDEEEEEETEDARLRRESRTERNLRANGIASHECNETLFDRCGRDSKWSVGSLFSFDGCSVDHGKGV